MQTYVEGPRTAVLSCHAPPDEIWLVQSRASPAPRRLAITPHKQTQPEQCQMLPCVYSGRLGRKRWRSTNTQRKNGVWRSWTEAKINIFISTSREDFLSKVRFLIGVQTEAKSFLRLSVLTDRFEQLHTSKKGLYILFIYISLRSLGELPNQYLKSFLYGQKL